MNLFDEIPRLEGERLLLRRLEAADLAALTELTENSKVYRFLPAYLHEKQYEDPKDMLRELYEVRFREKSTLILGVFLKEDGSFCGLAEFYDYKPAIHQVCVGGRLRERCWGRGLAAEQIRPMLDYLFSETDVEIVTASTMPDNHASARVLGKNGFIRTASAVPEDWGFEEPTPADRWFR